MLAPPISKIPNAKGLVCVLPEAILGRSAGKPLLHVPSCARIDLRAGFFCWWVAVVTPRQFIRKVTRKILVVCSTHPKKWPQELVQMQWSVYLPDSVATWLRQVVGHSGAKHIRYHPKRDDYFSFPKEASMHVESKCADEILFKA